MKYIALFQSDDTLLEILVKESANEKQKDVEISQLKKELEVNIKGIHIYDDQIHMKLRS